MIDIEQWRTARYGVIEDGKFTAIDNPDDPRNVEAPGARWIGGEHDYQLAQAVAKSVISSQAAPIGEAGEVVAYVPIHPTQGPLWANTVPSLDSGDRPKHYPTRPLYFAAQPQPAPSELSDAQIYERCARVCEKRAEERFNECGTREHDTGATYYSGRAAEELNARDEEDDSCAAEIRALAAAGATGSGA